MHVTQILERLKRIVEVADDAGGEAAGDAIEALILDIKIDARREGVDLGPSC